MDCLSRRQFLESCAAVLGVSLVAGCGSDSGGASLTPLVAKEQNGKFVVQNAPELGLNEAQTILLDGKDAGLVFNGAFGLGALSAVCTHAGCTVEWTGDTQKPLVCPCHGSAFATNGSVQTGPANAPLKRFGVEKQGANWVLTEL